MNQVHEGVLDREAAHPRPHGRPAVGGAHDHVALLEHPDGPLALLLGDEGQGQPPAADHSAHGPAGGDVELLAGRDHDGVELADRPEEGALLETREEVEAAEDSGVGHDEATRAMAATVFTVAWAVTEAQYPRQR